MISLYESLFDHFDSNGSVSANKFNASLIEEYIKQYCSGSFTYKILIDGTVNFNGNVKISHDKESFNQLFTINKIINGNLTITNCENLISLNDLFKNISTPLNGNLTINNCENLTDLNGCPEIVSGVLTICNNKKLKQLVGAPKEVGSSCYISKNGKRFKDDYVHDIISCNRITCSVLNDEDLINEEIIDESFKAPILNDFDNFLKKNSDKFQVKSLRQIINSFNWDKLRWDKIDMNHIEVEHYNTSTANKIKQRVRKAIRYSSDFVIVRNNDIFTCCGYSNSWRFFWPGFLGGYYNYERSHVMKETELMNLIFNDNPQGIPTEFYFIPYVNRDSDLNTSKLRYQREEAKSGMEYRTEEYNKEIAKANNKRYQLKLRELRARKKSDEDKKIINDYSEALTKIMKANTMFINNPEQYGKYDLKFLNDDMVRLGQSFNSYMNSKTDILKGDSYSYTEDNVNKYKEEFEHRLRVINNKLNVFNL